LLHSGGVVAAWWNWLWVDPKKFNPPEILEIEKIIGLWVFYEVALS
jgi:hypothetical protein